MSVLENWGTSGTAGYWEWTFSNCDSVTIGTQDGTACLELDGTNPSTGQGIGTALYPRSLSHDSSGSFYARFRETFFTTNHENITNFRIGENTAGTELWAKCKLASRLYAYVYEDYNGSQNYIGTVYGGNHYTPVYAANIWATLQIHDSGTDMIGTFSTGTHDVVMTIPSWNFTDTVTPMIEDASDFGDLSHIDYASWPYSPTTILDFWGTYNDGSSVGTVNLGEYVLTIGDVVERLYTPTNTRGWMSTCPITLDDSTGMWGSLVGNMDDPTWLDGTFWVRQEINGTWTALLTGYASADDWSQDYGNEIVNLTISSVLGKAAESTADYNSSFIAGASPLGLTYMNQTSFIGTIQSISDGTIIVYQDTISPISGSSYFHNKELLWNNMGTTDENTSIGSALHGGVYTLVSGSLYSGTFTAQNTLDWMTAGGSVYRTSRWPSFVQTDSIGDNPRDYIKIVALQMGLNIDTASSVWSDFDEAISAYKFKADTYVYGGERLIDVLNGMTSNFNVSYSVNGVGEFTPYCPMLKYDTSNLALMDFDGAYNNEFMLSWTSPYNSIRVKCQWDEDERKFYAEAFAEGTQFYGGRTKTIDGKWLSSTIEANAVAIRTLRLDDEPRAMITLDIEGSRYNTYDPGKRFAMTNLPSALETARTDFILMSRTYLYSDEIARLEFVSNFDERFLIWNIGSWNNNENWW